MDNREWRGMMSAISNWISPMQLTQMERLEQLRGDYLEPILSLLDEVVVSGSPQNSTLVGMTRYHMETGGKRLRAVLPLAVADALGHDPSRLVPFGAACEILHNATLVHDDLQDGDRIRRGAETIWVKFGEARAINLGDAMLYYTLMLTRRLEGTAEDRECLADRLLSETVRVIDGQEREFLLQESELPTWAEYVTMVEGKTSGLFALPLAGAAAFLKAPDEIVAGLNRAAGHLGVLFQIQDDVLDIFGEKGRGRVGSDIAEGKISALVVHALHNGPEEDSRWLRELLRKDRDNVSDEEIECASGYFKSTGALKFALSEIQRRAALAVGDPGLEQHPPIQELIRGIVNLFLEPISPLMAETHGQK